MKEFNFQTNRVAFFIYKIDFYLYSFICQIKKVFSISYFWAKFYILYKCGHTNVE